MSLYRKPRSPFWYYDFTYAGKRHRGSTLERTRAAAKTAEAEVLHKLSQGVETSPKSAKIPTLREFADRFLTWSDNTLALESNSRKFYTYGVRLLLFTRLADIPMDRITGETIECTQFTRPVIDRTNGRQTGEWTPCSPTYTNQALRTLRSLFGKAKEWGVVIERPSFRTAKTLGRDRLIDHDAEIALQDQFQASTSHGRHNRMRAQAWMVLVILQDTGMRPDELFPMRIEDIHWAEHRIWIPDGKTRNARRFVPLSERLAALLKPWCAGREGWVFPSKRSASGHLESISKGFQRARKDAGLDPRVVPYSARHTYGTFQLQATGNLFAVSASMGHADIKSMAPYQHPDTSQLHLAINQRNRARDLHRIEREGPSPSQAVN